MKPESKTIRLGCSNCDRDDHDGITATELRAAKKAGWQGVARVQTYAQACKTYDDPADEPPGFSACDWQTHEGTCPECALQLAEEEAASAARAQAWRESPEGIAWQAKYGSDGTSIVSTDAQRPANSLNATASECRTLNR